MPNIKEKKDTINVHYGDKFIQNMFNGNYGFSADKFWKMSSLKNFSRISINTRDKRDPEGNCKDLLTLNEKIKTQYNIGGDVCFTLDFKDKLKSKWTLLVMESKKGGLALKIYIRVDNNELSQALTKVKVDEDLFSDWDDSNFNAFNKTIFDMINYAKSIYNGYTTAQWVRFYYEGIKPKPQVQKFKKGYYYYSNYASFINRGYFKLIPWLNDRYLVLPTKFSVIQNIKIKVCSIIGDIEVPLTITQLPSNAKTALFQNWVSYFNENLSNARNLEYKFPVEEVDPSVIVSSADLNSIEEYINYILFPPTKS